MVAPMPQDSYSDRSLGEGSSLCRWNECTEHFTRNMFKGQENMTSSAFQLGLSMAPFHLVTEKSSGNGSIGLDLLSSEQGQIDI